MKQIAIGYSNGKEYPIYKRHATDTNIGLTEFDGFNGMNWCHFEYIKEI